MYLLQGLLGVVFLTAQVTTLMSCNDASFNVAQTVTTVTTITPVTTISCLDLKLATILPANQIGTTPPFLNGVSLTPSPTFTNGLLLDPADPLMMAAAAASHPSLSICDFALGNFSFNTTNLCSSTRATPFVSSSTLTPANTSTILSTTNLPTLPSVSSDTAGSTSTAVVVVSLVTTSGGGTATETMTLGSTSTASSSATSATDATSAACLRAQPIRLLFWRNWMIAKAGDQVLNAFGSWANAERAKSLSSTDGTVLDSVTTGNMSPAVKTTAMPKSATNKSAVVALLSTSSLLGLAVVILFFC